MPTQPQTPSHRITVDGGGYGADVVCACGETSQR
jgi:hypothetical protein